MSSFCIKSEFPAPTSAIGHFRPPTALLAAVLWLAMPVSGHAEPVYWDSFEGPLTSWQISQADGAFQIRQHHRVRTPVHSGAWCEAIQIAGNTGSYIYASYDIGRAHVVDELTLSLWLRADRPGLQIAARVVLPRTLDSETGKPVTMMIYGKNYQDTGSWQQLKMNNLPQHVARQARVLRSGDAKDVDEREAYIDLLLINVYGGQGVTKVWIDDVEIKGFVGRRPDQPGEASANVPLSAREPAGSIPTDQVTENSPLRYRDSLLTVAGKPLFPRIVQYQGESFAWLKQRGFNAIQLSATPTDDQSSEARRLGLWLVCPPPVDLGNIQVNRAYQQVIAWRLADALPQGRVTPDQGLPDQESPDQESRATNRVAQLRAADRAVKRPIVSSAQDDAPELDHSSDVFILQRSPVASSMEMTDYADWMRQQGKSAGPRSSFWSAIQTQCNRAVCGQTLSGPTDSEQQGDVGYSQLHQLVAESINAGARGLIFLSDSPLDAPTARRRARAVELINLHLQLIDTWLAMSQIQATPESSHPAVNATLLLADRVHILLPTVSGRGTQYVPRPAPDEPITFVIPQVATTASAFEVSPIGLTPIAHRRVPGGISVTMQQLKLPSVLLLTADAKTTNRIASAIQRTEQRAAQLLAEIARHEVASLDRTYRRLPTVVQKADVARRRSQADALLTSCQQALHTKDARRAYERARAVLHETTWGKRLVWNAAVHDLGSPTRHASLVHFETIPEAYRWIEMATHARLGDNLLESGEMEDVQTLLNAGWQPALSRQPSLVTDVEVSSSEAHSGSACLHLHASAAKHATRSRRTASPLVSVTSPTIAVQEGEWVVIRGWIRTSAELGASGDGLLIFESIAGPSLATRFHSTTDWQKFTAYRRASHNGPITLTLALHGLGDAWVDDLTIRRVRLSKETGANRVYRLREGL